MENIMKLEPSRHIFEKY